MSNVVIIGGGAAGMAAAAGAAEAGHRVSIYEKNEKLGKKIYITGKGRCNVTNGCAVEDFFSHVVTNGKFLYSAVYGFTNTDLMALLEESGCPLKVERGERVFPVSDKSSDIIAAWNRRLKKDGVEIHLNEPVSEILTEDGRAVGILLEKGRRRVLADAVILATGGLSYPSTGSTGDGYRFAKETGHTVTELSPALVPFTCKEEDVKAMQGLSLRNIEATVRDGKKERIRGNAVYPFRCQRPGRPQRQQLCRGQDQKGPASAGDRFKTGSFQRTARRQDPAGFFRSEE